MHEVAPVSLGIALAGGLANGAIYGLIALGLVLAFRVSHVVNFAHGAVATLATYAAFLLKDAGIAAALAVALLVGFGLGLVTERMVTRAGRTGHDAQLLVTVALFLLVDGLVAIGFGASPRAFDHAFAALPAGRLGPEGLLSTHDAARLAVVAGLAALLGLASRTRWGLATRAVAEAPQAAARLGLPITRIRAVAWGLSGGLGAAAGLLVVPRTLLEPGFLFTPLLAAFAAAVVGGFTSAPGALLAALGFGLVEALAGAYGPPGTQGVLPFALVLVALLVRPAGLATRRVQRRI